MTWQEEAAAIVAKRNEVRAREADALVAKVAAKHGISVTLLLSPCRIPEVVAARREVAEQLYARNVSLTDIGLVLNRDHTTVINLIRQRRRKPLMAVVRAAS